MRTLIAAGIGGLLLALAFAEAGWWWVSIPAIGLLTAGVFGQRPRTGFVAGTLFGVAAYLPTFAWLGAAVGRDAGVMLSVYTSLWLGLVGMASAVVSRLRLWWLAVPAVWVLVEAVAGRVPLGGWGWGRVGLTQSESPLLPLAALGGVPALTFAVVLLAAAGVALARATADGSPLRAAPAVAAAASVVLVSALVPVPTAPEDRGGPEFRQIGIVQGNVPQPGLDFNARRRAVLDNHVQQTYALAASGSVPADFVLWPENSSDIDPFQDLAAAQLIDSAAAASGAPLLVGAVVVDADDDRFVRNQSIVWDPVAGPGQRYTKVNLVPFGEYVPFRSVLGALVSRFDRVPRDFLAGDEPGVLDIGGTRIGALICFDVAYDDTVRDAVRGGARLLVVQTNNATFNLTAQPAQQFAISKIRAVEHGRAVAVVSTSGLSGIVEPDGTVRDGTFLPELVAGGYTAPVVQRDTLTIADRLAGWPELLVAAIGAAAVGVAGFGMRKRGTTRPDSRHRAPALSKDGTSW